MSIVSSELSSILAVALSAGIGTALTCYALLRKIAYNLLDPLIVLTLFLPFASAFLAVLCFTDLVSWDKFVLFALVLLAYLAGARSAGVFFSREAFRRIVLSVLTRIRPRETAVLLVVTVVVTLALAILGLQAGAHGDTRQEFGRLFRPLVLVQNGLFLFCLVLLASRRVSMMKAVSWLIILVALSIPFRERASWSRSSFGSDCAFSWRAGA